MEELEPTDAQEALKLIVEVFRDGRRSAANLRQRAAGMSPAELKGELDDVEAAMLSRISTICVNYQVKTTRITRH